jgi:hypothetical protein
VVAVAAGSIATLTLDPRQPTTTLASSALELANQRLPETPLFFIAALLFSLSALCTAFGQRWARRMRPS